MDLLEYIKQIESLIDPHRAGGVSKYELDQAMLLLGELKKELAKSK